MWCSRVSMACELKTGRTPSGKMSLWSTTVMPGASASSHSGVWPSVTM